MHGKSIISLMLIFIGILSLTPIQSRKIPRLIKKLNKALGLPKMSEKLFDFLPNIEANMAGIAGNLASIGTNAVDIQTNADNFFTNYDDIQALETMGSGSVWFDAFRKSAFVVDFTGSERPWTTIPYTNVRESSSNSGSIDINTGVFTAPLAGTYQFIIQGGKTIDVYGYLRIVHDGTVVTTIYDDDIPKYSTMTGTAILQMEAGQKVWAETPRTLNSNSDTYIHFTGVLIK